MTIQPQETTQQNRISNTLVRIFAVVLMVFVTLYPVVSEANSDKIRRPLDLPAGGGKGDEDEDETIPDLILFYGNQYEGDAFVWVLDVSGSMGNGDLMATLREQFTGAVSSLSSDTDFGAIAFSSNLRHFDWKCKEATSSRKSTACAWICSILPVGGTCIATAVVRGLEIVRTSDKENRRVIVVGDGLPECGLTPAEALADISYHNYDRIPIDTVFVGTNPMGMQFFQRLASTNYGRAVVSQ